MCSNAAETAFTAVSTGMSGKCMNPVRVGDVLVQWRAV